MYLLSTLKELMDLLLNPGILYAGVFNSFFRRMFILNYKWTFYFTVKVLMNLTVKVCVSTTGKCGSNLVRSVFMPWLKTYRDLFLPSDYNEIAGCLLPGCSDHPIA
jgi:hypothetical protein